MTAEADDDRDRAERLAWEARRSHGLSRRELIALGAAAAPVLAGLRPGRALAGARAAQTATPIVKPLPPEWFIPFGTNAEMRWEAMRDEGYLTPVEKFFVRNHTATPAIDPSTWRLQLFGDGLRGAPGPDAPLELSYRQLLKLPSRRVTAFIECAGNGRSFFASQQGTPAAGTPWKLGAVGVATWRGVPLREVLERAGLRRGAVDVMPEGLDAPVVSGGVDQGRVRRPLPIARALDDEVVLAYEMNGRTLPPDHGFPVRLVVPGWIGIASIKWLGRIEVATTPLASPWNTTSYRMFGPAYPPDSPPLTEQPVKSAFELAWNAQLPDRFQLLHGRAWSGDAPVRRVEVSADGGATWRRAHLRGPNLPNAWARWTFPWRPPGPGAYELLARATDRAGTTQPDSVPFNTLGYQFWAVVRHPVTVA